MISEAVAHRHHHVEITPQELRKYGFVMASVIAGLFGLFFPLVLKRHIPHWPFVLAVMFLLPALVAPKVLGPVRKGWMKFGETMGAINSRIILSVVYLIVVVPMGLVMKLFGRDALARKLDPSAKTYRVVAKKPDIAKRMEQPF